MALILIIFGYLLISSIYDFKKSILFSMIFTLLLSFVVIKNQESIGYRLNDFMERVGYNYIVGKSDRSFFDYGHGAHFLTGYEIFKDYPLFGSGLKTYREVCSFDIYDNIPSLDKDYRCTTHPHNYYIEIISETGLIGFSLFLISIYLIIKNNLFSKIENLNKISLLPVLIFLFPIAATNSFFTNWIAIIFFFILSFYKLKNN
jgi:O-antigen ligase